MEERGSRYMEPKWSTMTGTPNLIPISTKLRRIAKLAEEIPGGLKTLAHHIDLDWLREAYKRTPKNRAPGVDGQTAEEYAVDLDANLQRLLDRAKSGTYKAPPVRRVEIPKGKGRETRPIGIPTFEDKVLQRAVVMVLEPIYEQDFLDCSWGFRPGRSAHMALDDLRQTVMRFQGGWVIDLDVRSFFDTLDHGKLREILHQRVHDGVLLRLIGKWLKAGYFKDGQRHSRKEGTPQGGVISPLLANLYLHEVLDTWFAGRVKPKLKGPAHLVRYADDAVLVFRYEEDARRVLAALPDRFARYGLSLHPEKTRLVDFRKPHGRGEPGPEDVATTFDFLGFTHFWGRSRQGRWVVKRKTAKDRLSRATRAIHDWCRRHRHFQVWYQHWILCSKLRGHYAYYGIAGNRRPLWGYRTEVQRSWRKWLSRRSQRARLSWAKFNSLLRRYPLPKPPAWTPRRSEPL